MKKIVFVFIFISIAGFIPASQAYGAEEATNGEFSDQKETTILKEALDLLKATLDILEAQVYAGLFPQENSAALNHNLVKISSSLKGIDSTLNLIQLASLSPASPTSPRQAKIGPAPQQGEPRTANLPEPQETIAIQPPQPAPTAADVLAPQKTALPQIIEEVALAESSTKTSGWSFFWPTIAAGAAILGFILFQLTRRGKNKQEAESAGSTETLEIPGNAFSSNINHEPLSPLT